jgi:hypothetical protein
MLLEKVSFEIDGDFSGRIVIVGREAKFVEKTRRTTFVEKTGRTTFVRSTNADLKAAILTTIDYRYATTKTKFRLGKFDTFFQYRQ